MRILLPLVLLVPVVLLAACEGSTPLATFTVVSQEADPSCSKLLDFCMRVTCQVKNDGKIPGQAVVDLQILDANGDVKQTQTERLELGPGDTKSVSHDFTEAKVGQGGKGACVIR